jgi:POT family proton-dependent oligopeptide transporter
MQHVTPKKASFYQQITSLPANFWFANFMEILERLAFFGVRAIAPLFLVASVEEENGLGLGYDEKGLIYAIWALLQCLVPMVSGGYTERYGYRKSLVVAFVLNIIGYLGMAQSHALTVSLQGAGLPNAGFFVFMAAACFVACGTAIFKPPCHGTIAKSTTEETSSLGWGMFYWVVNIGGALAPMLAAPLRGDIDWHYVFYAAAGVTALNFLPAFLLFREPERTPPKAGENESPLDVFISSISTMVRDMRLVVFLLIFSCFWLMFMQLWDLLPNFIDEWVNTTDVAPAFATVGGWLGLEWTLDSGEVKPELLININSWSIIALVLIVSWVIGRINKVAAMIIGMLISLVGFVGAGMTTVGSICALMIFVFSIGEMACSPTFSAYVGLIAPPDKKALYMGYSNMPFAIGWFFGNIFGGYWYEAFSSKEVLARRYLTEQLGAAPDAIQDLSMEELLQRIADAVGGADATIAQAEMLLWNTYDPWIVWVYLGLFGLAGTIGMTIFYFVTRKAVAEAEAARRATENASE